MGIRLVFAAEVVDCLGQLLLTHTVFGGEVAVAGLGAWGVNG